MFLLGAQQNDTVLKEYLEIFLSANIYKNIKTNVFKSGQSMDTIIRQIEITQINKSVLYGI